MVTVMVAGKHSGPAGTPRLFATGEQRGPGGLASGGLASGGLA
jgi:hypothetical protein